MLRGKKYWTNGYVLARGCVYLTDEIYETGKFYDYFLMLINEQGEKEKQLHNGEEASALVDFAGVLNDLQTAV